MNRDQAAAATREAPRSRAHAAARRSTLSKAVPASIAAATLFPAHFSDRGRLFQADRGRRFSAIVDARGVRASEVFNVSQSSTIRLKRGVGVPLSMRPQGAH
jgi:hypothetical protein